MATLSNIQGGTLAANVGPQLRGIGEFLVAQRENRRQQQEKTQKQQEKTQKQQEIQDIIGRIFGNDEEASSVTPARIPGLTLEEERFSDEFLAPVLADINAELEEIKPPSDPTKKQTTKQASLARLIGLDPQTGMAVQAVIESGNQEQRNNFLLQTSEDAKNAAFVSSQPDLKSKQTALTQIATAAAAQGKPIDRFIKLLNISEPELDLELQRLKIMGRDLKTVLTPTERFEPVTDEAGNIVGQRSTTTGRVVTDPRATGGERGEFSKAPGVITRRDDGSIDIQIPVLNKNTGKLMMETVPVPGDVVSRLGETGTEKSLRLAAQAGQAELAKRLSQLETEAQLQSAGERASSQEKRTQVIINEGLTAADNVPILNRSIELLNSVETGGIDRAALAIRQFFGTEGADEAELSANLGKTVLSQLRTTFGAAFTEREGARLARIEASFGKSVEGNKRLLRQTKRIMERTANRAIKAAEKTGDADMAEEIKKAMTFRLDPPSDRPPQINPFPNLPPEFKFLGIERN